MRVTPQIPPESARHRDAASEREPQQLELFETLAARTRLLRSALERLEPHSQIRGSRCQIAETWRVFAGEILRVGGPAPPIDRQVGGAFPALAPALQIEHPLLCGSEEEPPAAVVSGEVSVGDAA